MNYKHILIVDDSSTSRMIVQRCFQISGLQDSSYYYAENGLDACMLLENNRDIDLILTDLNMPKMDGTNFIKKIKINDRLKKIPVFVVSSVGDSFIDAELLKLGVQGIIKKPISPAKVMEVIGGVE